MKWMLGWLGVSLLFLGAALAQTSQLESPVGVSPAELQAVQAQIPQPASTPPPAEMIGGAVGSAGTYRPADARQPRITRSTTLTLGADGTATFDWTEQGALSLPVQPVVTPIHAGAGVPDCWAISVSTTSVRVKCVVETIAAVTILGVGIIGSTSNANAAGMTVGVIVLPKS